VLVFVRGIGVVLVHEARPLWRFALRWLASTGRQHRVMIAERRRIKPLHAQRGVDRGRQ
jgi:hypothetical protein